MRKRAQMRSRPIHEEKKYTYQPKKQAIEKKSFKIPKNWWIAIALIGIFFVVLFHNTYFNASTELAINPDEEGFEKFYLSGPDPYYNMRLIEETHKTGVYPYYSEPDPLLNYPHGAKGNRAPLFNMMALGFSRVLTPFMDEIDAIGYSMLFIPALFGALLIFPVYFLGKVFFGRKAGLVAAFFISIVPIHLASGHGSAFSLFDHDSFNLLLYMLTFLFLVLALKEKDDTKSLLYALLAGFPLAGLSMTWVEARFLFVVIGLYAIIQMMIDIFTNKIETKVFRTISVVMLTGYIVALPVTIAQYNGFSMDLEFFMVIGVLAFGIFYYLLGKFRIPWTLSIPAIFSVGVVGLLALYFIEPLMQRFAFLGPISQLSGILFGTGGGGIYGNKVSMTIAEANTYDISNTVMSFGPALYWIGWAGLIFVCYLYYKQKLRRDFLFIIVLFFVNIWLAGTAGRFLNDMVPWIAILAGWVMIVVINRIDYKQMFRNIRSAGGGLHGIRRGIKFMHIGGILFIAFIVILPNAFVAFDAALPNTAAKNETDAWVPLKTIYFGEDHSGAYGLGIVKEKYWADAFDWLSQQDTDIENPVDRPAFISWWDYGFYEVALGDHPTVADNFQDGIPTAANFHTSVSEKEAVVVWIVRLLEGDVNDNNGFSDEARSVLVENLGENASENIIKWMESSKESPSLNKPIGKEYDEKTAKDYRVGQQYEANAVYQDVVKYLTTEELIDEKNNLYGIDLSDEEITNLYHDVQDVTGLSIRYYGVEGYDKQIFNIFGFLSDKSTLLVGAPEDDFTIMLFNGKMYDERRQKVVRTFTNEPLETFFNLSDDEKSRTAIDSTPQQRKTNFYNTMFYKTYIGWAMDSQGGLTEPSLQLPNKDMVHFYPEYISDMSKFQYYDTGKAAVVIAKYYEGAIINGSVKFEPFPERINNSEVVIYKDLTYAPDFTLQIDHDKTSITLDEETNEASFSLLAGAGSTLRIRRYPELVHPEFGVNGFEIKNVTFNDSNNSLYAPITDDDAMRLSDNYVRDLGEILIEPGKLEGYIYEDKDGKEGFNESTDEVINNAEVIIYEVLEFDEERLVNEQSHPIVPLYDKTEARGSVVTNETGHYSFPNLFPGFYAINVYEDNFLIGSTLIDIQSGNKTQDIAKPLPSDLEGFVYYDEDGGEYSTTNAVADAKVELYYVNANIGDIAVDNTTTASNGKYEFKSLVPGEYKLKAVKDLKYTAEYSISVEENVTKYYNISMGLYPVTVRGNTEYDGVPVGGITLSFTADGSVSDNTAEDSETTSAADGSYEVDLSPGTYNVSLTKQEQNVVVYESEAKLTVDEGLGSKTQTFIVEKKSITVSGTTTSGGLTKENVTIEFLNIRTYATISDGTYSIELAPGNYTVTATNETNENYYNYSGTLELTEDQIGTIVTNNIALIPEAKESDEETP